MREDLINGYKIECPICGETHHLENANLEAQELIFYLEKEACLDFELPNSKRNALYSTKVLFENFQGQMFGVLSCIDKNGDRVVLKAFSGQFNGIWQISGWEDPILPVEEFNNMVHERDPLIKEIGKEIDILKGKGLSTDSLISKRRSMSQKFMRDIHNLYEIVNYRDEIATLEDLFSQRNGIPSGTGDCCAPKLLNAARVQNLKPIGLTEFYWGAENKSGTKHHGVFYPPCYEKCEPLMGQMMCGKDDLIQKAPPSPQYDPPEMDDDFFVYWDDHIVVVNKPHELLSVPGRGVEKLDSVVTRVAKRFSCIPQPAVHRLDLETSGLMVVARTEKAHRNLSLAFHERKVRKTYTALLDGIISANDGFIELPFRLAPRFRPLQVYDPIRGKLGVTKWRKLGVLNNRTLIEFSPHTGRTHQLRLHSFHRLGLNFPIVGDRLYGIRKPGERLMLHASSLEFNHPITKIELKFYSNSPF